MHSAPSVTVMGDDGGWWRRVVRVICVGVVAVAAAWMALAVLDGQATVFTVLYGIFTLAIATLAWPKAGRAPASLHWDGLQWWWFPTTQGSHLMDGVAGQIQVSVDAGEWMLLRFTATSAGPSRWRVPRTYWLPLGAAAQPARWHALRCAVYSSQRTNLNGRATPAAAMTPHP